MSYSRIGRRAVSVLSLTLLSSNILAAGPYDELLPFVPADANALVLINPAKVRASAFAKTELADKYGAAARAAGSSLVSPEVERALFATHIDFSTRNPNWVVAIAETNRTIPADKLGARLGGKPESIAGVDASALPSDAFVFKFGPRLYGASVPADRQFATRWVRNSTAKRHAPPSAYLQKAVGYANELGTELVVAFDLEGLLSAETVREKLPKSDAFQGQNVSLNAAVAALSSLQGATLGVRFTDKASGKLRFDFEGDPAVLSKFAKPLAIDGLNLAGVAVDDFATWNIEVEGKSILLGGELTPRGLRQVLSLIDAPLDLEDDQTTQDPSASPSAPANIANNTLKNFKTIQILLKDAHHPDPQQTGTLTPGAFAQSLDRYAKKIDRLPILNVDPDMVNYAETSAHQLRELAVSYRRVGIKASTSSANVTWNFAVNPWYGTWWVAKSMGLSERAQAKRQEMTVASFSAIEMWALMDDAMEQLRRVLTLRYKVEFK